MKHRFENPWPNSGPSTGPLPMLRWMWQRIRDGVPPTPKPSQFPTTQPDAAYPRADPDELRITWLGQATFLIQVSGLNLLTDPMLSERASPFAWFGPARVVPAPLTVAALPPIDAVLLTHDHYDHLDVRTCRLLLERFGRDLPIFTPLGYAAWFAKRGAHNVTERDWWQAVMLADVQAICAPAQHWTRRGLVSRRRLWCSWFVRTPHHSVYYCGDSGYCPAFVETRGRLGAPDVALMPIGAYEPRWFMKPSHMNPEETVQAFRDLGAAELVAMHWGTFRLTDEHMLEPPVRTRTAWDEQGLPAERLHIPKHGETIRWRAKIRSTT